MKKIILFFQISILGALIFISVFSNVNTPIGLNFPPYQNALTEEDIDSIIIETDAISLKPGYYTVAFDYDTYLDQNFMICAGDKVINEPDSLLFLQDEHLEYDFRLKEEENISVKIKCKNIGYANISGISITQNNNFIKRLCVLVFVFFLSIDILYYLYKKYGSKENIFIFILLFAGVFLTSAPTFFTKIISGADLTCSLHRIESLYLELKAGHIPCRLNSFMLKGYGYPYSIYYGDIMLYPFALMRLFKFTISEALNACIFFYNMLTMFLAFYSFRKVFGSKYNALALSYVYSMMPYRLNEAYTRSGLGEFIAISFYPLIIMAVYKIYTEKENRRYSTVLAIGMSCVICTHILSAIMITFSLTLTVLFLIKKTLSGNVIKALFAAVFKTVLISAYFVIPFMDYYFTVPTLANNLGTTGIAIQRYGSSIPILLDVTQPAFTPGVVLISGVFGGVYVAIRRRDGFCITCVLMSAILLFMVSSYFPWDMLAERTLLFRLLSQIQFPIRFIGPLNAYATMALGFVLQEFNKKWLKAGVCIGAVYLAVMYFHIWSSMLPNARVYTDSADLNTITGAGLAEYLLKDSNPWAEGNNKEFIREADARITEIKDIGIDMDFNTIKGEDAALLLPRYGYKYYHLYDKDHNEYPLTIGFNNLLSFALPSDYEGVMYLRYTEPIYWRIAELISILSIAVIFYRKTKAR